MKCPACDQAMVEKDLGGIIVDFCKNGCKGIWFDWFELSKLDENNEGFGPALEFCLLDAETRERPNAKINCPKCGIPMHIHKYQSSKKVDVDECYACGGFFLDAGELGVIRKTFMTDTDEDEYLNRLIDGIPELAVAEDDLEKKRLRAKAIKGFTKHLRFKR